MGNYSAAEDGDRSGMSDETEVSNGFLEIVRCSTNIGWIIEKCAL